MSQRRASMINPSIEELLARVDSKFTLVTVSARRARQINAYFNQLGDSLGTMIPPQVTSVSRKPLSIALEEIVADKITFSRRDMIRSDENQENHDGASASPPAQTAMPVAVASPVSE